MSVSHPLVTMVTPVFNQVDYIVETVESVLAQTYAPIEYLVIDDGSSDGTADAVRPYADRLKLISQRNAGQAETLNSGWSSARGRYIGYLSGDDVLRPEAVARMVAALEADPAVVCAFPDSDLIDANSATLKRSVCRPFDYAALVVEQECHIGPGALFRRDAFTAVGGWRTDLKLAPDREFWMRLARRGRFAFVPESLAGYRLHPQSISYKVVSEAQSLEYIRVLDDLFAGGVPDEIAHRRDEAYGRAHFLIARNCFRGGEWAAGWRHFNVARRLHPALGKPAAYASLARAIVGKPLRMAQAQVRKLATGQ